MPPTDGPMETSGVVIGASGFGFVPPQGGSGASKLTNNILQPNS
jgi:hypothetical protein